MKLETLKLDFDNLNFREIYKIFKDKNRWISYLFKLKIKNIVVCKTRKGYHIYINVRNRLNNQDIVFLQLALGSDFMRECYYWKRIKYPVISNRGWNVLFFEKKYSKNENKKPSIEKYSFEKSQKLMKLFEGVKKCKTKNK